MGSTRLPGKVLAPVGGRPLLEFMLERLRTLRVDQIVVATSDLAQDDPVAEAAGRMGVPAVRGSEGDVLARFLVALDRYPADTVVRLTADCPLADPAIVEAAVDLLVRTGSDYASNSLIRTFPVGLDVEVTTADALRQAGAEAVDRPEREHVTPFVYRRPGRYRLVALRTPELLADERWTVDTPDDLERVRAIVAATGSPATAGWGDLLAVAGRRNRPQPGAVHLRPAVEGDDEVIDGMVGGGDALGAIGRSRQWRPLAGRLDDPSVRTWMAEVDRASVGWVEVAVDDGTARLAGQAERGVRRQVVRRLRAALRADCQVARIALGDPGPGWSTRRR